LSAGPSSISQSYFAGSSLTDSPDEQCLRSLNVCLNERESDSKGVQISDARLRSPVRAKSSNFRGHSLRATKTRDSLYSLTETGNTPSSSAVSTLGLSPNTRMFFTILGTLQADGGLPGADPDTRFAITAAFALAVLQMEINGTIRLYANHLRRMADFLDGVTGAWDHDAVQKLVSRFRAASLEVKGDWAVLYDQMYLGQMDSKTAWEQIRTAL